jgi:DnaA family protein
VTERPGQLTIPLRFEGLNRFENFHADRNAELVHRLLRFVLEPGRVWLWGRAGRGRTHLLEAACERMSAGGRRAVYLPLQLLPPDPALLDQPDADLVALDDLDGWVGDEELEAALMHLYQELTGRGGSLLVTARQTPGAMTFALADVASRLRSLEVFEVQPPDEDDLRRILEERAGRRGMVLAPAVLDFWLHRSRRDLPVLLDQLERLDARALEEQRRVTIPLLKEVLAP